jgi:dihydrofolate reductase / thymidylate synthase
MVELIVATDINGGIGLKDKLPWYIKDELKIFKGKTIGKTLVMGTKTLHHMPKLSDRDFILLTRQDCIDMTDWKNTPTRIINDISSVKQLIKDRIMIAGGAQVYKSALQEPDLVDVIHLSVIRQSFDCDTFLDTSLIADFVITEHTEHEEFDHYVMKRTTNGERQYVNLLREIITNGKWKTGRNGKTCSLFKKDLVFDIRNGFPLLTTKKMFFRGIVEELLFFMRGETDSKKLEAKKVNIWRGNTVREFLDNLGMFDRKEGILGPCYGYQWRYFNAKYDEENAKPLEKGVDQLQNVIDMIRNEPNSRRIMLTSYNPAQVHLGVLPPCHSVFIQFYVDKENLDMYAVNRSSDVFLGLPFNIASYALFLSIIAKITNKIPRMLYITLGDTHLYENHIEPATQQIQNLPYQFAAIHLPEIRELDDLESLSSQDFRLINYKSNAPIKADMVA